MKIAYVIPSCGISGGIAVVCQHANRLARRGHNVLLLSEQDGQDIQWFPNNCVPVLSVKNAPDDLDVLIATHWSTAFRVAVMPAKCRCYFVQSDETRFHEKGSAWEHITRLSYLLPLRHFTEARWIQNWLQYSFGHTAELVPNGLDHSIFYRTEPLFPKGEKPRVLLEGAIDLPYKGMSEAFKAVEDLDVEVWCVSSLGFPEKSWRFDRFFSQVPMTEMRQIYSSCDILLKLSRVEGFFGPPMEMMACGGAVVVGRVTGYDEYIVDGVNALVVDASSIKDAKNAVMQLIENKALREHLIEGGKTTARQWEWEPSIDRLEKFLSSAFHDSQAKKNVQAEADLSESICFFYSQLSGVDLGSRVTLGRGKKTGLTAKDNQLFESASSERLAKYLKQKKIFRRFSMLVVKLHYFLRSHKIY
jgi:O-antigen biosynthesis protein